MSKPLKVAIYIRVSTKEQHAENQLPDLRTYAAMRHWEVIKEYTDQGVSGVKASRPAFDEMLDEARRGRLDVILCWSVSRFGRSMANAVAAIHEMTKLGVSLVFLQQSVDTTTSTGRFVAGIFAGLAELEWEERRERVRAGIKRARTIQGKRWGRPKKHIVPILDVEARLAAGESLSQVAKALGIPKPTLHRQLQKARRLESPTPDAPATA
jgi:DNA invertase Pin-like site-specific DNA recombinase